MFRDAIAKFEGTWESIEVRAVVARKDDSWVLLGLGAMLSVESDLQHEVLFDNQGDLLVLRQDSRPDELGSVTDALGGGSLDLSHPRITSPVTVPVFSGWHYSFVPRSAGGLYREWPDPAYPYPYLELASGGKSVRELVDEGAIANRLRRYGYDGGLPELTRSLLGFPIGYAYSVQYRIIAPVFAALEASVAEGRLTLGVTSHRRFIDGGSLIAVYQSTTAGGENSRSDEITFTPTSVVDSDGPYVTTRKEFELPRGATSVRAHLFHRSFADPLDTARVSIGGNLNFLISCMRAIEVKRGTTLEGVLEQHLGIQGSALDDNRFEAAALNLFAAQSFVVLWAGHTIGARGVDLIVSSPDALGGIFLVSVTTSNNIEEKIRTLVPVRNRARDLLGDVSVNAVILTGVPRNDILKTSFQSAEDEGIALLSQEDLKGTWEATLTRSPAEARKVTLARMGFRPGPPL